MKRGTGLSVPGHPVKPGERHKNIEIASVSVLTYPSFMGKLVFTS